MSGVRGTHPGSPGCLSSTVLQSQKTAKKPIHPKEWTHRCQRQRYKRTCQGGTSIKPFLGVEKERNLYPSMGNEQGKNSRLGITAMAYTTPNIEHAEMMQLADKLRPFSDAGTCSRFDFDEAIKSMEKFDASDVELFTRLFVMFDTTGESQILFKEFLAGVGGILLTGQVGEKLEFACCIYDYAHSGLLTRADLKKVLNSLNLVASYFGDPVVTPDEIDCLVMNIFDKTGNPSQPLPYKDYLNDMVEHETTVNFVTGRGTVRFGR